jgi:glycosyltransferase involved in cell wall biosynthesis
MESKAKILIATGIYPPSIGGPATYSKLLKDELPKRGFEIDVLSFDLVRHLPKGASHFFYFLKVLQMGQKADIIFAQDPVSVGLPTALASKILRKKFIIKIVGDFAWEQHQNKTSGFVDLEKFQNNKYDFLTEARRKIEHWVAGKADKIIAPSEYLKKIIKTWGVAEERIDVIYNAIGSENAFDADNSDAEKIYLLSVGRLVPWKGFGALIDLMPELPEEIKLVIIGGGPEKKRLEDRVKSLELENRVELAGSVPHEKMKEYFAQARIFVLNTGYEGLSHVLLESMSFGAPVITTNIGGNPELIKNGWNGILVEYDNKKQLKEAIIKLWQDADLRRKFINNSFEELKKFSKEKMIKETADELNQA